MIYRTLPHGGEKISVLGLGANGLAENSDTKEIQPTYEMAIERGINFFDLAGANAEPFVPLGKAIKGKRDKVYLQVHFGADYSDYKYGWTMDTKKIAKVVEQQFKALDTDYADFGFIHCIDQIAELKRALDLVKDIDLVVSTRPTIIPMRNMASAVPGSVWTLTAAARGKA